MAGTAVGALGDLARVHERLTKAEAKVEELRVARDEALRTALAAGNTYTAVQERTGLSRATITKASRRQ